ncbi:MAG: hypothetical protein K8H77_12905 [Cutibacterium acnes]|nr:hypothetical protein [Cutibacterium acnes]
MFTHAVSIVQTIDIQVAEKDLEVVGLPLIIVIILIVLIFGPLIRRRVTRGRRGWRSRSAAPALGVDIPVAGPGVIGSRLSARFRGCKRIVGAATATAPPRLAGAWSTRFLTRTGVCANDINGLIDY